MSKIIKNINEYFRLEILSEVFSMEVAVAKYPRKRRVIWPWILIGSLLLFIVAPVAVTYILLYDGSTKQTNIDENFDTKELGTNAIVDSLDSAPTEGKLSVKVTGDDLDNIIDMAFRQANLKNQYLKKLYCVINENKYSFYLDLDGIVIKSRARIVTELDETEDSFYFKIVDIGVGKIGGILNLAKPLIKQYLPKEMVDNVFKQTGLSLTFDDENYQLIYKKDDVMKDLQNMMGGGSGEGQDNMFMSVLNTLMENGLAHFDTHTNNFLEVNIDLTKLQTNECVTDDPAHIKVPHAEVTTKCKQPLIQLINNHIVDPENDKLDIIFGYLFSGYEPLSDESKDYVDDFDFSSIGITDVTAYKGFDLAYDPTGKYLENIMSGKIMSLIDLIKGKKEISLLLESNLNTYIEGRNILGYTTLLHRQDGDTYKVNYITIDNFYSNLYHSGEEDIAEFVIKLNINGYPTSLTFVSNVDTGASVEASVKFIIKEDGIKFGQVNASSLNETFFSVMGTALQSGDGMITADQNERSITVHLSSIVEKAKTSVGNSFDSNFSSVPDGVPLTPLGVKEEGMDPLDPNSYYTKAEIKAVFLNYLDALFIGSNAEVDIVGEDRSVDGEIVLKLKENNPPDAIKKLADLYPTL